MAERNEKKKKRYAEPEMGYCTLSIRQPGAGLGWACWTRAAGAGGTSAGARRWGAAARRRGERARGVRARGVRARGVRARGARARQ